MQHLSNRDGWFFSRVESVSNVVIGHLGVLCIWLRHPLIYAVDLGAQRTLDMQYDRSWDRLYPIAEVIVRAARCVRVRYFLVESSQCLGLRCGSELVVMICGVCYVAML